ncbi:MAG: PAS domain-containing protein [Solirubrobacteraceae bacterium]
MSLDRTGTPADRRLFSSIVSEIDVGLYVWHLDDPGDPGAMRLVYANPASVAATGIPVADVLGLTLREAFPELAETDDVAVYAEVALGGETRFLGGVPFRGDLVCDRSYLVRVFALPLQRVAVEFNDVTGLREAEGRALETLESMSDGFYMLDADMCFTYVNAEAERLLGHRRADLVGRGMLDVLAQDAAQPLWAAHARALREQVAVVVEERYEPRDRWFSMRLHPGRQGLVVYFQDVTEQKRLESQLLQSQKLEAVGHLAAGVAHDFNNLLTVIEGYAALAQHKLSPDASFVADALREIRSATASATALTAKLLAFSREQPLHPVVADINGVVASALSLVAPLIGEDIAVHRELDPRTGSAVVDMTQIEQVLVNLAVNARDAMPGGGNLWVATGSAELAASGAAATPAGSPRPAGSTQDGLPAGSYGWVSVRDDGCGMDGATLRQIFDPFFTTKPEGEGTGLGLSTAFGTIRQAGGRLEVASAPGAGTTFTIWLPQAELAVAPSGAPGGAGRARILLVEDEAPLRRLLAGALRGEGHVVIESGDSLEALRLCSSESFDLLVTDSVMPGGSGVELARAATARDAHLPVLHISGAPIERDPGDAAELSAVAFLAKPFSVDELLAQVSEMLERSPA